MLSLRKRTHRRLSRNGDSGFTLVELLVTMGVISAVLLGLIAVQTKALVTNSQSKQRQQATAVGNQVMEQLRTLPYVSLSKGLNPAILSADPNIVGGRFRPAINAAINEVPVATNTGVTDRAPIAGAGGSNVTTVVDSATSNVTYTARSYVTRAAAAALDSPMWLSVVVTWTGAGGKQGATMVRSEAFSPTGCLSTTNRPFSGPCQAFLYGDAAVQAGSISVRGSSTNPTVLTGGTDTSLSLPLAQGSAGVAAEQTVSLKGSLISSGASAHVADTTRALTGQVTARSVADDDYGATGAPAKDVGSLTQSSTPLGSTGTNADLTLTPSASDSGTATSVVTPVGTDCLDPTGAAVVNQSCSSTAVRQGGTARASLDLKSLGGRDLPAFDLASVGAPAGSSISWTSRYVKTAGTTACTTVGVAGCVAAGVKRQLGTVQVGNLPPGSGSDSVPALADGMVKLTGYVDTVNTELSASTTGSTPTGTRTGTLRYRTSTGYADLALSPTTSTTITLPNQTATYTGGTGGVRIDVAGSVVVTPLTPKSTVPDAACAAACLKEAVMPSMTVTLTYTVRVGATVVDSFDVVTDLGALRAASTYKAAPSA